MARLGSHAGVPAGDEEGVTRPADGVSELPREPEAVALGDATGPADVLAGAFLTAVADGLAG